jgi:putative transcriptional regulator
LLLWISYIKISTGGGDELKIQLKDIEYFQELLLKKGYSRRQFGRTINISEPYAQQIAKGQKNPSARVAKLICDALEVEFDDIFFIDNARKRGFSEEASSELCPTGTEN